MRNLIPPGRSLTFYALLSWVVPSLIAGVACIFAFLAYTAFEYKAEHARIEDELSHKSITVARRLSAELLIGKRGAVQSVSDLLKAELGLAQIEVSSKRPDCIKAETQDSCTESSFSMSTAFRRVPIVSDPNYVALSARSPSFWQVLNLRTLLSSTLPIALMLGLGLLFQRIILRRYFLTPLQTLIATSTGEKQAKSFWPTEIRDISERLYRSFEDREEAVFSQIARGVIHDLRTLIHTPLSAVDLVAETATSPARRAPRLEHLYTVCAQQLPKIRTIIDNTLDGSRDIPIRKASLPLADVIDSAAQTLSDTLTLNKASLHVANTTNGITVAHDRIQLERALTNLIKNGIEACQDLASPDNRQVEVSVAAKADCVTIDIEDSGPGLTITPNKLFRPLKSTKTHGSGLGLIISRKIVEAHGGRLIPGKSNKLGGAKFSIELPFDQGTL